jgi:phage/plasmid-like protein (TIGR03299 family)
MHRPALLVSLSGCVTCIENERKITMAHEVQTMAYVNEVPWHGLGNPLTPEQPIESWQIQAGMNWRINETEVLFNVSNEGGRHVKSHADSKVLYRSDNHAPLSVVSNRYKVVQPHDVLEFYRDLTQAGGFQLETAGVLKEGRKLWALAKTGQEALLKGGDKVKAYLLLATSCDGSLCTTAQFTSVRVVCNNTLQLAVGNSTGAVRVPHSRFFDPQLVKQELGLGLTSWENFVTDMRLLAERKVNKFEAMNYLINVLGDKSVPLNEQHNTKAIQNVYTLFNGQGKGSDMVSASGTAWGLLNGITEFVDHSRRARSQDYRLDSAWFGQGAIIKEKAYLEAMKLAA